MTETLSRKLAVLLHADVVGSTALVQQDETLAHQRMQDAFRRFSKTISSYGGIAHEVRGDALVAEFARSSDAISAALAFQSENQAVKLEFKDGISPELRIGIAMGEVIVADQTVTGEGVVMAQRIEQLAKAGKVAIQGAAYETVPRRLPFCYDSLGERQLKGFAEPVRVFTVDLETGSDLPGPEIPRAKPAQKPSIAVLPFNNMSGDPEQEYFSDGITEDIITALSCISGLLVVARNSTMIYKGKAVDVKQVGIEQDVRYVLEGSVRKSGNRIRVTAQLIDAASGHHLWADRYDRELDDIFSVQDDITHQITVEMRVRLSLGEKARMLAGRTRSVQAWQRQLKADELNNCFIRETNREARSFAREALKIDPNYVSAWTELGWTYWEDALCGWTDSTEHSVGKAREAAQKALDLEQDYPLALSLLAYVHLFEGHYEKAIEVSEKAVDLAPNNSECIAELAHILVYAGDPQHALEVARKAIRLTPMGAMWHFVVLGLCHYRLGQSQQAIDILRRAIEMKPDSAFARIYLVSALVENGALKEGKKVASEVLNIDRRFSLQMWRGALFRDKTINTRMIDNLRLAGLN